MSENTLGITKRCASCSCPVNPPFVMKKSFMLDLTQLVEEGVTPQYSYEINTLSDLFLASLTAFIHQY